MEEFFYAQKLSHPVRAHLQASRASKDKKKPALKGAQAFRYKKFIGKQSLPPSRSFDNPKTTLCKPAGGRCSIEER